MFFALPQSFDSNSFDKKKKKKKSLTSEAKTWSLENTSCFSRVPRPPPDKLYVSSTHMQMEKYSQVANQSISTTKTDYMIWNAFQFWMKRCVVNMPTVTYYVKLWMIWANFNQPWLFEAEVNTQRVQLQTRSKGTRNALPRSIFYHSLTVSPHKNVSKTTSMNHRHGTPRPTAPPPALSALLHHPVSSISFYIYDGILAKITTTITKNPDKL